MRARQALCRTRTRRGRGEGRRAPKGPTKNILASPPLRISSLSPKTLGFSDSEGGWARVALNASPVGI